MATAAERETVVQFDDASEYAVVYTHHERWKHRLAKLGAVVLDDNGFGGFTYHVPRSWIRLPQPPKTISEGQLAALAAGRSRGRASKVEK